MKIARGRRRAKEKKAKKKGKVAVGLEMVLTAALVSAIVASRATVGAILRRTVSIRTTVGKGLRHPHLCGISLHGLLTLPSQRNRRSVCRRMGSLEKRASKADQSVATTLDSGGQFPRMDEDSEVDLETGPATH